MHDDPFARAVDRVEAAEQAREQTGRRRRKARFSAYARTGFRVHASVYVAVNFLLIVIWASLWQLEDAPSFPWFIYVLFGWGIGLVAHYAAVRHHLTRQEARPLPEPARPGEAVAPPAPSTATELSRLAELHHTGALSDEEFSAAKAKLLT
jgi:2TM domain/Short C-terminal domain